MIVTKYFDPLLKSWEVHNHRMPDNARNIDYLGRAIARDSIFIKYDDDSWLVITDKDEYPKVMVLGEPDSVFARKALKKFMDTTSAPVLTAWVPAPAQDYLSCMKDIGFKYVGRLRNGIMYDGKLSDVIIMDFAANAKKGRRRRGRRA